MAFQYRPVFFSGRWSPLFLIFSFLSHRVVSPLAFADRVVLNLSIKLTYTTKKTIFSQQLFVV